MKLLYVLPHFITGAVPKIILDIYPYLAQEIEVKVLVIGSIKKDESVYKEFLKKGIPINELQVSLFNPILSIIRLNKFFKRNNFDIVHTHLWRADIYTSIIYPKDKILVSTLHSVKKGYRRFPRFLLSILKKRFNRITCVSKAVKESWLLNEQKSSVIYNPVNIEKFKNSEKRSYDLRKDLPFNFDENSQLLLSVGSLRKAKGHAYLIKAFHKAHKKRENLFLAIAGRGEEKERLENLICQLGLKQKVKLLGFRNDIPELLYAADAFVFPSLWEGLGIAVLEAMASKTPVVASSCPAIKEYIINGKTGFLSPPKDVNELSKSILKVTSSEKNRKDIAENAFRVVKENFNAEEIAKKYNNLYQQLISEKYRY